MGPNSSRGKRLAVKTGALIALDTSGPLRHDAEDRTWFSRHYEPRRLLF